MRGGNDERRDKLNKDLLAAARLSQEFIVLFKDFTAAFEHVTNEVMKDITTKEVNAIPPGTSVNRALRENIFALTICIDQNIPLMIIGKPGTSKTLSVSILRDFLNDKQKKSKSKFYKGLPEFNFMEFCGS